ncbi:hypothetical protein DFJ43DRAFT_1057802 [Lentinula guzmanii]|uniref:Uncharacterized protein n=1 Tax=Lentinula guzmanii TaxID=2804957 RepID=A0AA38JYX1_9AGAR|nr:hypothetical protein DFJ43DRAFT_1057802 [Lentinula guzmanii]
MVGSLNPSENVVETFHFVSIVVETIFAVIAQNFGRSIRVIPMLPNPMLPRYRMPIGTYKTRKVIFIVFFNSLIPVLFLYFLPFIYHVLHLVHHLSITFPNPLIIRVTFISHTCHPYVAH